MAADSHSSMSWQDELETDSWKHVDEPETMVIRTPEHWDDLCAQPDEASMMWTNINALQDQMRHVCGQVSGLVGHVAQLQAQLALQHASQQQQFQEAMAQILAMQMQLANGGGFRVSDVGGTGVGASRDGMEADQTNCLSGASSTASTAASTSAASASSTSKPRARPGPRERMRLRQEQERRQREAEENSRQCSAQEEGQAQTPSKRHRSLTGSRFLVASAIAAGFLSVVLAVAGAIVWGGLASSSVVMETTMHLGMTEDVPSMRKMRKLGHLRLSVSNCPEALHWFRKALEAHDSLAQHAGVAIEPQTRVRLQGDMGLAMVCDQQFEEGAEVLRAAVAAAATASAPTPPHWLNSLGYAYFHLREYETARDTFQAALAHNEENPILWNNLAAASMSGSAVDLSMADEALYQAANRVNSMKSSAAANHYRQVISNNIHILRAHANQEALPLPAFPHVEHYSCMIGEVQTLARTLPEDMFVQTVGEISGAPSGQELVHSRGAVRSLETERVLCPDAIDLL